MKKIIKLILRNMQIDLLRKLTTIRRWNFEIIINKINLDSKKYLIASNVGGNINTLAFDITLAKALESRGHQVDITLCGGGFSGCMFAELNKFKNIEEFLEIGNSKLCKNCNTVGEKALRNFNFKPIVINPGVLERANFNFSESGLAGAKRFLAVSNLQNDEKTTEVVSKFCQSSHLFQDEFRKVLNKRKYDGIIAHHGIYVPQGDIVEQARRAKIPIFTWVQGYRKSSYIFSEGDTYHKTLLTDKGWDRPLTKSELITISNYLDSRDTGQNDWIRFGITTREVDIQDFFPDRKSGKTFLLLTNVSWDAQLHYESNTFSNMFEWLESTIIFFVANPNLNLIIRVHPAERTGTIKSNEPVKEWIEKVFPILPKNIYVIEPQADVSTYSLMKQADFGIIYASKSGLEMLALGKPVIVAGEAWIKNKGICLEPKSQIDYFELIKALDVNISNFTVDIEKVLRYAHYFFFRRTIMINSIEALDHYPYVRPNLSPKWETEDSNLLHIIQCIEKNLTPKLE